MAAHDDPFTQFDDIEGLEGTDFSDFDNPSDGLGGSEGFENDFAGVDSQQDDSFEEPTAEPQRVAPQVSQAAPVAGESKPFLKTGIGMLTAGLAAVGVIGGGAAGYSMLSGGEEYVEQVVSEPVAPPSEPSFAQISTPSPAVAPVNPAPAQNVSPLSAQIQADSGQLPAPVQASQPVQLPAQVPALPQESAPSSEILAELKSQGEDIKLLKEAVESITADSKLVRQQLARNERNQEVIQKQLTDITEQLKKARPEVVAEAPAEAPAKADGSGKKAEPVKVAPVVNPLAAKRSRIPDYHVVEASASGEMAIIKSRASDRVFTVFKGEVLNIGGQRLVVDSIADKGHLVLVGSNLYIDKTLETRQAAPAPKAAPKAATRTAPAAPVVTVKDAKGFTLNAVYDSDSSFGVVDDKGSFKSYKVGQSVPELGGAKVIGLDDKGNLKVGDYVIKSIY